MVLVCVDIYMETEVLSGKFEVEVQYSADRPFSFVNRSIFVY